MILRAGVTWLAVVLGGAAAAPQNVPDAPSASRPAQPFPTGTKPAGSVPPKTQAPEPEPPAPEPAAPASATPGVKNAPLIEDVGTRFRTSVSFVTLPVTVKDSAEHAVFGLQAKDFTVYEDGTAQNLSYFTSDPYPLSAAVVIDQGMSDTAMRKINQTLAAITAAFSEYDELALYTYSNTVHARGEFQAASEQFTAILRQTKSAGREGGVPVTSGPLAAGPTINGRPLDPGTPRVVSANVPSRVLNDALLQAALDLSKRERARRRVIFLISDGRESGSNASYTETLKVLLTHQITVFALGVDAAAIPLYQRLNRMRVPGQGTANIVPKYVAATGGQLYTELGADAISRAYAQLTGDARNQYTLGYNSKASFASGYRSIEVRVRRPGLKVFARDGYYPLPPPR